MPLVLLQVLLQVPPQVPRLVLGEVGRAKCRAVLHQGVLVPWSSYWSRQKGAPWRGWGGGKVRLCGGGLETTRKLKYASQNWFLLNLHTSMQWRQGLYYVAVSCLTCLKLSHAERPLAL